MDTTIRPRDGIRPTLVVLFLGAFAMGSADLLVVGMLDLISTDLAVSVPRAGALVTAFALGMAIGGPVLALLTAHLDRRGVLLIAVAAFALLNLVPVLVPDYTLFLLARAGAGAVEGLYVAAALTAVTGIVSKDRSGRAIGLVITGFATASALGLPLGTLAGQVLGWRASFAALVGVALGVLVAGVRVLPSVPTARESRTAGAQLRSALAPRVQAVLALCCLVFAGVQSALTYLVPFLGEVTEISGTTVVVVLFAFGVATTAGSAAGARLADVHAARTLVGGTVGLTAVLATLYLFGGHAVVAVVTVVALGLLAMGMAPALQSRVMGLAGPGAALAASLPASAANAGDSVGAFVGGVAISQAGVAAAVLAGAGVTATAAAVAVPPRRLHSVGPARDASPTEVTVPTTERTAA